LVAEWKHDSEPELLRTSNVIVLGDRFPGLRGFYHAKFQLWRIEDINAGAEIPSSRWPPGLVAVAPPDAAPGQPPPPAVAADVSEEEPRSPPPQPATSHAPGRPGSSNHGPPQAPPVRAEHRAHALAPPPLAGAHPPAVLATARARPDRAPDRFLHADELRYLLQAYPDYRRAIRWGVFLPDPFIFTVAGPERDDIIQLLPRADDVPEGSIRDLDDRNHRRVRTRNNMTTWRGLSEFFQWLTRTPNHTWLGRTVVVHRPPAVTVQNAVLLRVCPGDVITLLGAPFWIWHTTDFLEGSFVVPTVIDATDNTTESEGTLAHLGLVHVSSLLPPGSQDPNTLD